MKTTFKKFRTISLRPALYNGTEFEIDINFDEASVFRTDLVITEAINMMPGDTVRIGGYVFEEDTNHQYINIYMCGDALTSFISKYGTDNISAVVSMKLELIYGTYTDTDYCYEPKKEEIAAYKLIEITGN